MSAECVLMSTSVSELAENVSSVGSVSVLFCHLSVLFCVCVESQENCI